jgi:hypothetical protein
MHSLQKFDFLFLNLTGVRVNWSHIWSNVEHRVSIWARDWHVFGAEAHATHVLSIVSAEHRVPKTNSHRLMTQKTWVEAIELVQELIMDGRSDVFQIWLGNESQVSSV